MRKGYEIERVWETDAGYKAVIVMSRLGHRCGYIGIPKEHSLYRRDYATHCPELGVFFESVKDCPIGKRGPVSVLCAWGLNRTSPDIAFNVHGSITFANGADWDSIYPTPNTNLWWFGYDCAHAGDGKDLSVLSPELLEVEKRFPLPGEVRSLEYCVGECESLATQLRAAETMYRNLIFRKF